MKITGVAKKQMAAPVFTGTATAVRKVSSNLLLNYLILLAEGVSFKLTIYLYIFLSLYLHSITLIPPLVPPVHFQIIIGEPNSAPRQRRKMVLRRKRNLSFTYPKDKQEWVATI